MIPQNKILGKLVLLLSLMITALSLSSQTLSYEDIIAEISQLDAKQRYSKFFEYQKQDPHFANTYIQLGDACEKIFADIDPLRNIQLSNYWANNAILYYGLFPVYLKSNEVRRNREYYENFPIETQEKKVENEDVLLYVENRISSCRNYIDSLGLIFNALEKSKDHYNNCVKIFNEINDKYDNLNNALLQTNNDFLLKITDLETEYNSTVEEFSNYQEMIKNFPLGNYKQEFKAIPIQTFRLDGLTNSDFFKNSFTIWDYGKWVENYRKTFNNDIVPLRNEVVSINKTFNDNKRRLSIIESIDNDEKLKSFDELFMFRLGKYDNNSLVRDLFRYLNIRQDFLVLNKSPLNLPNDSSSLLLNRKYRYYHGLALQKVQTSILLDNFNEAISQDKIEHFFDFFNQQYQGNEGLRRFHTQEGDFLTQTLEKSFENLKADLSNEKAVRNQKVVASGARGISIPLYNISQSDPDYNKFSHVTKNISYNQGIPQFASGHINRLGRKPMAFIARIEEGNKVEWIREIGAKGNAILPNGDNTEVLFGFENGALALVSGKVDSIYRNTIIKLDNTGNELLNKGLDIHQKAIFLNFDEINQLSLMAFGLVENDSAYFYSSILICQADSIGNVVWKTPIEVQGTLVDVIKSEDKQLAFINFKNYIIKGEQKEANEWGLLMLTLSENGEVISALPITYDSSFHIDRVFAISNDEISLMGYASEPESTDGKLIYIVISPEGNIVFKNF
jgi:hypothetical protein